MLLQTGYNEVVVLQQGGGRYWQQMADGKSDQCKKISKKSKNTKSREVERYNGKLRD